MSLFILFHFLCAQHVSDINISIIRSLRLFCWITTLVVLFLVRCVLEFRCGLVGVAEACNTDITPTQPHRNSNTLRTKKNTTTVVFQQNSLKFLMMDSLMSETCWADKNWNKIASDIKLVFYSSTITMMHGPINTRYHSNPTTPKLKHTSNQEQYDQCGNSTEYSQAPDKPATRIPLQPNHSETPTHIEPRTIRPMW